MKVAVGFICYSRKELSKICLMECLDNLGMVCDFYVWDNNSTDGTAEWIRDLNDSRITKTYFSDKNIGVSAYNYIFQDSGADYYVELDDDAIPPNNYVFKMYKNYKWLEQKYGNIGFLGIDFWPFGRAVSGTFAGSDSFKNVETIESPYGEEILITSLGVGGIIPGTCRMSSRKVWNLIGGQPDCLYGTDKMMNVKVLAKGMVGAYIKSIEGELVSHLYGFDSDTYTNWKKKNHYDKRSVKDIIEQEEKRRNKKVKENVRGKLGF